MKDDLPNFPHDNDSRNHAKMKALRARFGWTGYGQFWALNEMIAGSTDARMDISRKVVRASTACELGMTTDALDEFLRFLSDPDECGLINYSDGIVTTDRTQEAYEIVKKMREDWREKKNKAKFPKTKTPDESDHTADSGWRDSGEFDSFPGESPENPQLSPRENQTFPQGNTHKEKERKVKEIKEPKIFSLTPVVEEKFEDETFEDEPAPKPDRRTVNPSEVDAFLAAWNAAKVLPPHRGTRANLGAEAPAVFDAMSLYTPAEISEALANYVTLKSDLTTYKPWNYPTPISFLKKGISQHLNQSKPLETFALHPGKIKPAEMTEEENLQWVRENLK